jgi:hypothetical protein
MPTNRVPGEFPSHRRISAELDCIPPNRSNSIASAVRPDLLLRPASHDRRYRHFTAVPANLNLDEIAGQDSLLHKKHKVWLHRVGVANLPQDHAVRLEDMAPEQFKHLKLLVLDPYDCILSKLERASPKDRDDVDYLFRSQKLDARLLRERYKNELRHNLIGNIEWHDQTLELWIEIFEAPR